MCITPQKPAAIISGRAALFNYHTGLAVNAMGSSIFVADTYDNMIREVYCAGKNSLCVISL